MLSLSIEGYVCNLWLLRSDWAPSCPKDQHWTSTMLSTSLLTVMYCTPKDAPDRMAYSSSVLWVSTSSFRPQLFIYVCVRLPPVFISLLPFWLNFASVSIIPSESEWLIRYSKPTSVLVFPSFPRYASAYVFYSSHVNRSLLRYLHALWNIIVASRSFFKCAMSL